MWSYPGHILDSLSSSHLEHFHRWSLMQWRTTNSTDRLPLVKNNLFGTRVEYPPLLLSIYLHNVSEEITLLKGNSFSVWLIFATVRIEMVPGDNCLYRAFFKVSRFRMLLNYTLSFRHSPTLAFFPVWPPYWNLCEWTVGPIHAHLHRLHVADLVNLHLL